MGVGLTSASTLKCSGKWWNFGKQFPFFTGFTQSCGRFLLSLGWHWPHNTGAEMKMPQLGGRFPRLKKIFALFSHHLQGVQALYYTYVTVFLLARDHFEVKILGRSQIQDMWSEKSASSSSSIIIVEHTQWGTDVKPPWSPDQGETIDRKLVTYVEIEKMVWYFISLE